MEIITNNIFRLSHQNSLGETEIDGTGFIADIAGQSVLVSCGHVFQDNCEKIHSFTYNHTTYTVEKTHSQKRYFESCNIKKIQTVSNDLLLVTVEDYAFYRIPFDAEHPIRLKTTLDVKLEDELCLVTRNEHGTILQMPCKLSSISHGAYYHPKDYAPVWATNLLDVEVSGLERGFSGAPIIHIASNTCIGILQGGTREKLEVEKNYLRGVVIPSDTLAEKFLLLSEGTSE